MSQEHIGFFPSPLDKSHANEHFVTSTISGYGQSYFKAIHWYLQ